MVNSVCFHPGASVPSTTNGQVSYTPVSQRPVPEYFFDAGDTIQYTCEQRGHRVIGLSAITCQVNSGVGTWTRGPPDGCTCCAAQCSIPPIPNNAFQSQGSHSPDGIYYEGDTVEFWCLTTGITYSIRCTATGIGIPGAWTDPGSPCGKFFMFNFAHHSAIPLYIFENWFVYIFMCLLNFNLFFYCMFDLLKPNLNTLPKFIMTCSILTSRIWRTLFFL